MTMTTKPKQNRWLFTTQGSGSTLMCVLLCNTIKTYVEPRTLEHATEGSCIEVDQTMRLIGPEVHGPKVCLYRKLPMQLLHDIHLGLDRIKKRAERVAEFHQYMRNSSHVLWIESNDFFKDVRGTMDMVCDHFQIPPVKDIKWSQHNVKPYVIQRLNYAALKLPPEPPIDEGDYDCSEGIISMDTALSISLIQKTTDYIRDKFPHLDHLY
mgnify:CR=1 FL=1